MIKWVKPNGTEIQTNDRPETIEYCESLKWARVSSLGKIKIKEQPWLKQLATLLKTRYSK